MTATIPDLNARLQRLHQESLARDAAKVEGKRATWERIQREAPDLADFVKSIRAMDPGARLVRCVLDGEVVVDGRES